MNELPKQYLTRKQALQKYPFFTENMLKNLLFSKKHKGFRTAVVRKLGSRVLIDEEALLAFLADSK